MFAKSDACRIPLPDKSVDLVFGSPPYTDCRLYLENGKDLDISRNTHEWVEWMLAVTEESLRVSKGAVVWIAWGPTRDRNYQPACEGLMWEWFKRNPGSGCFLDGLELPGSSGSMYRPCYWHRVGISGSGGDQWFRADVEYAMCFKRPGELPWADNTAMGHPPKWAPGGEMSHRLSDGTRRNQWGGSGKSTGGERQRDGTLLKANPKPSHRIESRAELSHRIGKSIPVSGERRMGGEVQNYIPPVVANPGCLIHVETGGGRLGWEGAHENEAPFPEDLAEWFIKSLVPHGGVVLDCFSGSGTTTSVANAHGRHGIGFDLRMSQCRIGRRRLERPHQVVPKRGKREHHPLFPETA